MSTSTFKCPQCNAPIFYPGGDDVTIECMFCGHNVIIPSELRTSPGSATSASAPAAPSLGSLMKQISAASEIAELARNGDKLEAIKRYREVFNVELAEAKDAVDKMAAGQLTQTSESVLSTPQFSGFNAMPTEGAEPDVVYHVKQLLGAGKKIEAIKLYRQATGLGLKEAKDAVEAIEAGQPVSLTNIMNAATSADASQSQAMLLAVKALLQAGNKIEAIKVYRQLTGVDLKEAKDAVEAMEAGVADANTFQMGTISSAYQFQRTDRPATSPTPSSQNAGLSCIVVGLIAGAVFLGMMVVAVALLIFNLAG